MAAIDDFSAAAALAATALFTGTVPTTARFTALLDFAKQQYQSYSNLGVGTPALGPFEALGKAFAADASTKGIFATYFGGGTNAQFVDKAYDYVYDGGPNAGAKTALLSQVQYFTSLYQGAGIPAADAALQARGAVLGQIIGYAFTDPAAASRTVLDDVVKSLAADASRGDFSNFGKALSAFPFPAPGAVVVNPTSPIQDTVLNTSVAEVVIAKPGFYGNQYEKFVVGQDKIDLSSFTFASFVVKDALPAAGPSGKFFIVNGVQHAAVINSGGLFIDTDGNGNFAGADDIFVQLIGTQGNPSSADLIFG